MYPSFVTTSSALLACAFWGFLADASTRDQTEFKIPPAFMHRAPEITAHAGDWKTFGITNVTIKGATVTFRRDPDHKANKKVQVSQTVAGWELRHSFEKKSLKVAA